MRSRELGDWVFLAVFFLGFFAVIAPFLPGPAAYGTRFIRILVAFASGIGSVIATVAIFARVGWPAPIGYLLGIVIIGPPAATVALRAVW